ncbi:hypothetical protein GLGCALEP_03490 [Pseudomonas sp. MM221]|nr:hypothetical protein DBADOPDK_03416 [Pseudomonas sp. MM223]CAI3804446.1 hypothetical protein GLGCALEP_03490 [Pseudomonas sp. MM221]
MRLGPAAWQAITDAVEQAELPQALPCEVKLPPGTVIGQGAPLSTLLMAITQRASKPAHAQVFSNEPAAQQPHPEPIAWMVGTAFWWTKEEAERDAAVTGLQIVGLGPMTASIPAEQSQGIPVGEVVAFGKALHEIAWAAGRMPKLGAKLYTHADPGEVERLRATLTEWKDSLKYWMKRTADLNQQLAERDALLRELAEAPPAAMEFRLQQKVRAALSASAEPSAQVTAEVEQ